MTLSAFNCGVESASLFYALSSSCFEKGTTEFWTESQITAALTMPAVMGMIFYDADQEPIGFFLGRVIHDEAEILLIGVIPAHQNQGLGALILSTVLERFKDQGVSSVFLEVRDGNKPALNLYHKYGFGVQGRRKNYYRMKEGNHVDALLLSKKSL